MCNDNYNDSGLSKKDLAKQVGHKCLVSRRNFLITSGVTTTVMVTMNAGTAMAEEMPAQITTFPRKFIAKLSDLKADEPLDFNYPDEGAHSESMIVKLGVKAGGGLGTAEDIVAYNYACTHQETRFPAATNPRQNPSVLVRFTFRPTT